MKKFLEIMMIVFCPYIVIYEAETTNQIIEKRYELR